MTTADGTVTEYGYDSCGRIVDQTVTTADGKSVVTTYTYRHRDGSSVFQTKEPSLRLR